MDSVDGHSVPDPCEILGCQLDVTCRAVLKGALDISVYARKKNVSKIKWHNRNSRAAWDWYDPWPKR
jgi:hypothetical protein